MVNDIQNRINPTVIQKERQVDSPEKFVMNPKTLPLAFGMQDGVTYNHYIDPTIYNIVAYQLTKVTTYDDQGQPQYQFQQTNVTVQRCTEDHFQNMKTKEGFLSLPYESLYCIDPKFEEIIEGDYSQPNFQQFVIQVYPCVGQGCGNTATLGKGYFAIYFQDVVVDPEIKDEPFRFYNRDLFWTTSLQSPRDLNMYFRNNYIESDYGWVTSDIETIRYISYSYQDLSFTSGVDYFLQLILRFEKQKENVYSRKYKNLTNVISEMGGFAQSMLAIGFILCTTLSDLMLNKSIINDAFDFKITEINQQNKKERFVNQNLNQQIQLNNNNNEKKINNNSPALQVVFENQDQCQLKVNIKDNQPFQVSEQPSKKSKKASFNKIDFNPNFFSNDKLQFQENSQIQVKKLTPKNGDELKRNNSQAYLSQIIKKRTNTTTEGQGQNQKDQLSYQNTKLENVQTKKNDEITNDQFKKLLRKEKNSMELSIMEYIKYFFWPFGSVKRKKQIIDYSIQKLYYHLDVIYIVKKLLEVDKLKQLIMDKDQIQLFEYISKPVISDEEVFGKQNEQDLQEQQEKYSILYQDNRSEIQKVQDAYQSYQSILKRDLSAMDKKILNHLDPQLVNIFNYQEQRDVSQIDQQVANPQNTREIQNNNQESKANLNDLQKQKSETQYYNQLNSPISIDRNLDDNYFENIDIEEQIPIEAQIQNQINYVKTSEPQNYVKKVI
ncbi:ABC transporter family protein (macronuclear) [Tetrahymena thermophila SB210]|uniref:ABC transporter family protein n=1 Tax=Tetrahymena thermophila (strain SB210) TaxID=312017 RepID=Q22DD7_TETTS|nr:ABC transporter family protein [Tetrahymena thermophila SB210]EAR83265.2 ABC transporter family protein [Tetrahymena thermophila SB210]|eukprot:XP_001030928.2 ABC transporter family protein [Tetrahymena thermophila SB210]